MNIRNLKIQKEMKTALKKKTLEKDKGGDRLFSNETSLDQTAYDIISQLSSSQAKRQNQGDHSQKQFKMDNPEANFKLQKSVRAAEETAFEKLAKLRRSN